MTPSTAPRCARSSSPLRMPPLSDEGERRKVLLQRDDDVVAQRRQLAVLLRADAVQPGVAGMDDEHLAAALGDGADEVAHEGVALDAVDADPVLDGDRDRDRVAHRAHAVGDERRLGHQAGAERAALDALARAAAVEVDLGVAPALAEAGARREVGRVAAAELQRHRLLDRIEVEMARRRRRAAARRWSSSRCRGACASSAGDGSTGNAGRSSPSSARPRGAKPRILASRAAFSPPRGRAPRELLARALRRAIDQERVLERAHAPAAQRRPSVRAVIEIVSRPLAPCAKRKRLRAGLM